MSKKILFTLFIIIVVATVVFFIYKESMFSKGILKLEILGPDTAKIGDEIQRLWRADIKYKPKKSKEIKKFIEDCFKGLEKSFEFYYQFNIKKAEEIAILRDKLREESMSLTKDKIITRIIRHSLKIIEEATDLNQLTFMIKLK